MRQTPNSNDWNHDDLEHQERGRARDADHDEAAKFSRMVGLPVSFSHDRTLRKAESHNEPDGRSAGTLSITGFKP